MGFIFAVTSWHARQNFARPRPARVQAATEQAKASRVMLGLLGGGRGVLLRIIMLAERYVPLKYCGVWCKMGIRYHTSYCNTYFFVSTIPKILTEFSFGIGMVITKKYQPIPT